MGPYAAPITSYFPLITSQPVAKPWGKLKHRLPSTTTTTWELKLPQDKEGSGRKMQFLIPPPCPLSEPGKSSAWFHHEPSSRQAPIDAEPPSTARTTTAALALAKPGPKAVLEDEVSSPDLCCASQDMLTIICRALSAKLTRALPVSVCCAVGLCPSSTQDQDGTWVVQMGYAHICSLALSQETCSRDLFSFLCHVAPWHWHSPLGSRYVPLLSQWDVGWGLMASSDSQWRQYVYLPPKINGLGGEALLTT